MAHCLTHCLARSVAHCLAHYLTRSLTRSLAHYNADEATRQIHGCPVTSLTRINGWLMATSLSALAT
ncbi:MAG: hypothetical protein ACRC5V_07860 [Aeromonas sp.]